MTTTFVAAAPGSWIMAGPAALQLASHESAHAVMAVVRGLQVESARIDGPDLDAAGLVRVVPALDRLFDHLLAVLAGPVASGTPLEWRPSMDVPGDEGTAALLVDKLHLDATGWLLAHCTVVSTLKSSRPALVAVGNALVQHGALPGAEVTRAVEESGAMENATLDAGETTKARPPVGDG